MLKYVSFGSGSSGNSSCLITDDGEILLIDAGVGKRIIKQRFCECGININKISNIIVTHDHTDHIKSVGMISEYSSVPVYTTNEVHKAIAKNSSFSPKISTEYKRFLIKNLPHNIGSFVVTPFEVPHDSADNIGFSIQYQGITFCLMTDIGYVTEEMEHYINTADYLVIEANFDELMLRLGSYPAHLKSRIYSKFGHLCNVDCGNALAKCASKKLKEVWLCHISNENNRPDVAYKTVEKVLNENGIQVGKDFKLNVLNRKAISGPYELKSMNGNDK